MLCRNELLVIPLNGRFLKLSSWNYFCDFYISKCVIWLSLHCAMIHFLILYFYPSIEQYTKTHVIGFFLKVKTQQKSMYDILLCRGNSVLISKRAKLGQLNVSKEKCSMSEHHIQKVDITARSWNVLSLLAPSPCGKSSICKWPRADNAGGNWNFCGRVRENEVRIFFFLTQGHRASGLAWETDYRRSWYGGLLLQTHVQTIHSRWHRCRLASVCTDVTCPARCGDV